MFFIVFSPHTSTSDRSNLTLILSSAVSRAFLAAFAKNLTDTPGLDYCLGLHAISHFPV